jgi:dipeptidyl aminopeptidase/acylaminoacyl peptidase
LIVHGGSDETVPWDQSRRLASCLPLGRLETIRGADHRYSRDTHFEDMVERISGFLIRHLQGN